MLSTKDSLLSSTMRTDHLHTSEAIRHRLSEGPEVHYLRDSIYGGIDGAITTFAIVAGAVGAELSSVVVIVLGVANLLADGLSMAAGNYSATRAEVDVEEHLRAIEKRHIELHPEGEREEIRQIFAAKGFSGEHLESVVEVISADHGRWIQTMLTEEYGLPLEGRSPWRAAWATFSAFLLCGGVPLIPYLLKVPHAFAAASITTAGVFFVIGCARARWSVAPWWKTGLGTLGIGGLAAAVSFAVGRGLSILFGV